MTKRVKIKEDCNLWKFFLSNGEFLYELTYRKEEIRKYFPKAKIVFNRKRNIGAVYL